MLWKVDGTEIYIFGGLHLGHRSFYPLSDAAEKAFAQAQQVWFEAASDDTFQKRAVCSKMQALRKLLKPKLLTDTVAAGRQHGLDPKYIVKLRPWAMASILCCRAITTDGFTLEFGLERHLEPRARNAGKSVRYLETADDQFDVYDAAPRTEQDEYLRYFLYSKTDARNEFLEFVRVWKEADHQGLEKLVQLGIQKFPFFERLLFDRNRKWLPKLKKVVDENQPAFICVGASHLAGKESLGALFAKEFERPLLPVNA